MVPFLKVMFYDLQFRTRLILCILSASLKDDAKTRPTEFSQNDLQGLSSGFLPSFL